MIGIVWTVRVSGAGALGFKVLYEIEAPHFASAFMPKHLNVKVEKIIPCECDWEHTGKDLPHQN